VPNLDRRRLEDKIDDQRAIDIAWDKIATVTAAGQFEVGASDDRRFVSSPRPEPNQILVIVEAAGPSPFAADGGNRHRANRPHRSPSFEARLTGSATATQITDGEERDNRGTVRFSYPRHRGSKWFVGAASIARRF
jgi:hypothetical protein